MAALILLFKKIESYDKIKYHTFYSNSKSEIIINESDTDDVFQSIYTTIISNIQNSVGKGWAGLLIQSLSAVSVLQSIILQLEAVISN